MAKTEIYTEAQVKTFHEKMKTIVNKYYTKVFRENKKKVYGWLSQLENTHSIFGKEINFIRVDDRDQLCVL